MYGNIIQDNLYSSSYESSGTETVIGEWRGKTLYRQTLDFGSMPNATAKTVALGTSFTCSRLVHAWGCVYGSLGFPISTATDMWWTDGSYITVTTTTDRSAYSAYFCLEYTKT